jgi:ubiquinone/menaquinone biosynthesis C-methylase UbiE
MSSPGPEPTKPPQRQAERPLDRAEQVHHPIFARFFDRLTRVMEPELGKHRDQLLAGLSGRVLEVGAGNGSNFSRYPSSVAEVVAIEPEPFLRAKAELAAQKARAHIHVQAGVAAPLPFEANSFDAAVASLVLCTVPDLRAALAELRRVLKPDGELRFFEHVRSPQTAKARLQRAFDRSGIWPLIAGGCHCSRPTTDVISESGFHITEVERIEVGPSWMITNPHVRGMARATP